MTFDQITEGTAQFQVGQAIATPTPTTKVVEPLAHSELPKVAFNFDMVTSGFRSAFEQFKSALPPFPHVPFEIVVTIVSFFVFLFVFFFWYNFIR